MTTDQRIDIARGIADHFLFGMDESSSSGHCDRCGANVPFLPLAYAAELEKTSITKLIDRVERGELHARSTTADRIAICLPSMLSCVHRADQ